MSQGDYIRLTKTKQVLTKTLPPVLSHENYTSFQTYHLETTVANTKHQFSRLIPESKTAIFEMEQSVSGCPTFPLCVNTHARTNRKLNTVALPMATKRLQKLADPMKTKTVTQGHVQREVYCNHRTCKCGTRDPLYRPPYNKTRCHCEKPVS
jgi:hypothetical protein